MVLNQCGANTTTRPSHVRPTALVVVRVRVVDIVRILQMTTVAVAATSALCLRVRGTAAFASSSSSSSSSSLFYTTSRQCCSFRPTFLTATPPAKSVGASNSYRPRRRLKLNRSVSGSSSGSGSTAFPTVPDYETQQYYARPVVQWYPGHIAKAERVLAETIKAVDVVIEVRDARLPLATMHPMVATWCAGTPRIVVLTRVDAIPAAALDAWRQTLERHVISQKQQQQLRTTATATAATVNATSGTNDTASTMAANATADAATTATTTTAKVRTDVVAIRFLDAQTGTGVHGLIRTISVAGAPVHARRTTRGLLSRPLRVGIVGYPNVGKSTLINRIIGGKKRCKTANIPGVTRSLQWIRVKSDSVSSTKRGREFEVLDSPGVIPATLTDQSDAMLVAACNCIGEKAYDNQAVATHLCTYLLRLHRDCPQDIFMVAPQWRQKCVDRYHVDPLAPPQRTVLIRPTNDDNDENDPRMDGTRPDENSFTGEDMLFAVADATCQGNPEDAARKILQDFRTGRLGPMCLQIAPSMVASGDTTGSTSDDDDDDDTNRLVVVTSSAAVGQSAPTNIREFMQQEQQERSARALETVKARGLVLPTDTTLTPNDSADGLDAPLKGKSSIGKGLFDGW